MKTPNAPASMKSRTSTESHKYQKLPYGEFFAAKPKESWLLGVSLTPQSHFVRQLPVRGAFWCYISSNIKPALKGDSSRARPVGDAARGESGGIGSIASGSVARRPYSNQRCGFRVAKAGGVAARLLLFTSTPQSATPTASRKGEPYEERISLLAQAPCFDAEIHRRSCVGEKSQTFSLFRR